VRAIVYEVEPYVRGLRGQVAKLQQHLWRGSLAWNTAYLEWKYEQNPYLPDPLIYLAVDHGTIVGMRGVFGSCWEAGSERFIVPCADDFVIAPAHRQRGLFGRIMSAALSDLGARGHRVAFSLSAGPVTLAGSLAGGWSAVGSVQEMCWRSAPPSSLRRQAGRAVTWFAQRGWSSYVARVWPPPFRRLDKVAPRAPAGSAVWCAQTSRPEAMADLVARLPYDGRIRHVRDARYLAWRFANPFHEYRFLLAGADRLDGYLVLQAHRLFPGRGVNIVDWEADDPDVRRALLRATLEWGGYRQVSTWSMSLSGETRGLLEAAGFVPAVRERLVRQGPVLLVRALGGAADRRALMLGTRPARDPGSWDFRMLYSMAG
jgi:GNAT superfamily N-acetyltransferase